MATAGEPRSDAATTVWIIATAAVLLLSLADSLLPMSLNTPLPQVTVVAAAAAAHLWLRRTAAYPPPGEAAGAQAEVDALRRELSERGAEAEQERARFEAVLEAVPFGLAILDPDRSRVRLNAAGVKLLGIVRDVHPAKPEARGGWFVLHERQLAPIEGSPLVAALLEGRELRQQELELQLPDRQPLFVLASVVSLRNGHGRWAGSVAVFADITRLKSLEHELQRRREAAERTADQKTHFLAAISHDIRTPANAISLLAELIQRTASDPAMAEEIPVMAGELQSAAMDLVELVTDALDMAMMDAAGIHLKEREFSLDELLNDKCHHLQPLARKKGLVLECLAPPHPIRVRTDRVKLGRVVENLIGNAIKFTPGGRVSVETSVLVDGRVEVRVIDTGPGLSDEEVGRLFDASFQMRRPHDPAKGAGLGLTISKRLLEAMGGELAVKSRLGQGSTFFVWLPASRVLAYAHGHEHG